jgi:hypothetical protein
MQMKSLEFELNLSSIKIQFNWIFDFDWMESKVKFNSIEFLILIEWNQN